MVTKLQTFRISNKFKSSRKYKPNVLHSVNFIYMNAACVLENKNPNCC